MEHIFITDAISLDFRAQNFPLIFPYLNTFLNRMSLFCIVNLESNKNKKSVKFQGERLIFVIYSGFYIYHKSPP